MNSFEERFQGQQNALPRGLEYQGLSGLSGENLELKEITRIAAMTMSIERNELASRVDRLTMRIRGLGTEVQ